MLGRGKGYGRGTAAAQPPDCENVLHELIELKVETHTTLLAYARVGD